MSQPNERQYDVAIIGGGPGGSTTGTLLMKYNPALRVVILEKERFPREHVGESQLPPISAVLDEMGCWEKVEAANFPIKVGATFRWGKSPELWDFEFLPLKDFKNEPRPGRFERFRKQTAFQVDRSIYDKILLDHAAHMGCEVREETQVGEILRDGDRVTGLRLRDGASIAARYYVDASGHSGILRRALGVEIDCPTALKNVAIWDYWDNADWAVEIGVGGTRIQIMTVGFGWLWFIPLGPTHTSLGLVCPAQYYKDCGKSAEELYFEALSRDPRIQALLARATRRGPIRTTKDWSFVSDRTFGENWFLVGEAAGFADPILSAGLTLTHTGGRELAFTIIELDRHKQDAMWLKNAYDMNQKARVRQHIRFADYWYAANGQFGDLQEHCRAIAREGGLELTPQRAWRWLAQGGFSNDFLGQAGIGGYDLAAVKQLTQVFTDTSAKWQVNDFNVFKLNLLGAREERVAIYDRGRVAPATCHVRAGHRLPLVGMYGLLVDLLNKESDIAAIYHSLVAAVQERYPAEHVGVFVNLGMECLEVMLSEGWVTGKLNPRKPRLTLSSPTEAGNIHAHRDPMPSSAPR